MNKIVYYIWNVSIIALIVISVIPFSTGLSNVVLGISIICGIISYKKLEISEKSKLLIIAYCSLLGSLLIAGVYNGTVPGKTVSFVTWTLPFISMILANHLYRIQSYVVCIVSISGALLSLIAIWEAIGNNSMPRLVSIFSNANILANTLIQVLPFSIVGFMKIYKSHRIQAFIILITILLNGYVLIHTYSRGGFAGFIIGGVIVCMLYGILNRWNNTFGKITIIIGALCISVLSYLAINPSLWERNYDNERLLIYKSSINMWYDHPVFGVGLEQWKYYYKEQYISPKAKEPNLSHPHNTFLYFLTGSGLIGALGYIIFNIFCIIYLIRNYLNNRNHIMYLAMLWVTLGIIIQGFVDLSMGHRFAIHLYMLLLGYMIYIDNTRKINNELASRHAK